MKTLALCRPCNGGGALVEVEVEYQHDNGLLTSDRWTCAAGHVVYAWVVRDTRPPQEQPKKGQMVLL